MLRCSERLRESIQTNNRADIALDMTAFYFVLRVYFDSIASLVNEVLRLTFPKDSRMWPPGKSFNDQLKWFQSTKIPPYLAYANFLESFSFDIFLRNQGI